MVPLSLTGPGERIRVARVITRLNVGGPSIQALLLTERLDPDRYETLLVAGRPGAREGDMLELRGAAIRPVIVPSLVREISPAADARAFLRLAALLREFRPHIVHTHLAKAGFLGRIAARLVRAPVVVHTFHGNVLRGYFGSSRSALFLTLERTLARLSTRVVAISDRQAAELLGLAITDRAKLVRIPLGLELEPFLDPPRGRLRTELGVDSATPLVGVVARLVPIKAVDLFLEAAAEIARALPEARFVVVGDGDERAALVARARRLGLADRAQFLGWRADLPSIYGDLDVVALTSRNEGTPLSVIESLAAGRAIVATAVGGVPDVVRHGETGVLVPSGDATGLAREIVALLRDPERRRSLGLAGQKSVFPEYDAATLLRRVDALYRELLEPLEGRDSAS